MHPNRSTAAPREHPYVEEGDEVSVSDTVGLIEAMKSFHEVKTQEDGTISKFLVENEDAVDAGQDLVRSCLTGQGGSPACLAS